MGDEETVQPKPLAAQITPLVQRQEAEEEADEEEMIQAKPLAGQITPLVQRQEAEGEEEEEEEEPIQAQPLAAQITPLVQRQDEDEEEEEEEPIQAKPLAAQITPLVQRQDEDEEEEEEEPIQAKPARGPTPRVGPGLAAQIRSLKGGGRPLSRAERGFFEPRFGYDFGRVRVHTNGRAAELSRSLKARAFTHGRDIVLGSGRYRSGLDQGRRLLAHELTHVVQQAQVAPSQKRHPEHALTNVLQSRTSLTSIKNELGIGRAISSKNRIQRQRATIPGTGARYHRAGKPLAFVLDNDPRAKDVGLYFRNTLQVTTIFVSNYTGLSQRLLKQNIKVNRLILIFHGNPRSGPNIWSKMRALEEVNRGLRRSLLPTAVVELWVCFGGLAGPQKRKRLKRIFGREIRATPGKIVARAKTPSRPPITKEEEQLSTMGQSLGVSRGILVSSCAALYRLRRTKPKGTLLPRFAGSKYQSEVEKVIQDVKRQLLRLHAHLVTTKELNPARSRMTKEQKVALMCGLLSRSHGEIRHVRIISGRKTHFPATKIWIAQWKRL